MKTVIYPGSFDPFTKGHKDILERIGENFPNIVVAVGKNSDKKYMFSFAERVRMIQESIGGLCHNILNVDAVPFSGLLVDFAFEQGVNTIVRGIRGVNDIEGETLLHRVGESQKLGIDTFFLLAKQDQTHISSSTVKSILKEHGFIQDYVSLNVKHFLEARMHGQYFIGLTGGIGAGKSYITENFLSLGKELGIEIHNIDLDKIGHWILGEATDTGYMQIRKNLVSVFGGEIEIENGFINRKKLGAIVFNAPQKRKQLDAMLLDALLVRIKKEVVGKKGLIVLNGALIVEANMTGLVNNHIVLVGVSSDVQEQRLRERGYNEEQIITRVKSQFSTLAKKEGIEKEIGIHKYGSLVEIVNDGNNEDEIRQKFFEIVGKVDVFGELRIQAFFSSFLKQDDYRNVYIKIKELYDAPERLYHNWFHVVDCLNQLYLMDSHISSEEYNVLFCAILFHDIIYDAKAGKGKNELQSADYAGNILKNFGFEIAFIEEVKRLILLTAGHKVQENDKLGKYLVDIDLSILGRNLKEYQRYSRAIQREYSCYTQSEYCHGRIEFLKSLLTDNIFLTDIFYQKYEQQAHKNIAQEIEYLSRLK